MIRVTIASPQEIVELDRGKLRDIVRAVLQGEDIADAEISLAFVDNDTIHRLNKRYLDHDEPTDVLTFPLGPSGGGKKLSGEIVIGAEVAAAEASQRGHDVHTELALYVIHGVLHLCGYVDAKEKDRHVMRSKERHYLKSLALPDIA
ncbi:MAG: rRNA maturation RNase YbeY [Planctomycetes bacterium]|nr:rRNA maturation RNase YbeY [Planctomycetota bacterium]